MGRDHIAFVQVSLTDTRAGALETFNRALQQLPTVEQSHIIASGFDYLLKVRKTDITA
jgi:Lrp/AsnC family leucine-responsive transcriptional regulator